MPTPDLKPLTELEDTEAFRARHIGPTAAEEQRMLARIGTGQAGLTRRQLIETLVPRSICLLYTSRCV